MVIAYQRASHHSLMFFSGRVRVRGARVCVFRAKCARSRGPSNSPFRKHSIHNTDYYSPNTLCFSHSLALDNTRSRAFFIYVSRTLAHAIYVRVPALSQTARLNCAVWKSGRPPFMHRPGSKQSKSIISRSAENLRLNCSRIASNTQ